MTEKDFEILEKEIREKLREHYKRNSEKTKRLIENGEKIIGGVYTDGEIKEMIEIDIESWKEAIKNNEWGFRNCTGARFFFNDFIDNLTEEEKVTLMILK